MLFDMRPLTEIGDAEIQACIEQGISERLEVEYKRQVNYRDDDERAELLRDICSFANANGGYFFVGVSADGFGRPKGIVGLTEEEALRVKQAIAGLVHQHIEEKLLDFDIQEKTVSGKRILVARIGESDQKPHMVTISNRTEFCIRYVDGKRAMSYPEVREAFRGDSTSRMFSTIESALQQLGSGFEKDRLSTLVQEGAPLTDITDGELLADEAKRRFLQDLQ